MLKFLRTLPFNKSQMMTTSLLIPYGQSAGREGRKWQNLLLDPWDGYIEDGSA